MHVCTYTHTYTCIHTHTHTYIHTHTHTMISNWYKPNIVGTQNRSNYCFSERWRKKDFGELREEDCEREMRGKIRVKESGEPLVGHMIGIQGI